MRRFTREEFIKNKINIRDMLMAFLFPTLVGKILVLCFGAAYALYPGEGYGYGLAASLTFTLCMVARFLWKYRHYSEEDRSGE